VATLKYLSRYHGAHAAIMQLVSQTVTIYTEVPLERCFLAHNLDVFGLHAGSFL